MSPVTVGCRVLIRAALALVAVLLPSVVFAQGTICFSQNFNSGSNPFNFAFEQTPGSNWSRDFPATGGWNSTPGLHITFNAGFEQYDSGYSAGDGACDFPDGSSIFVRFRVKWDSNYRWDGDGSMQDKMVIFGDNDTDSRFILMNERDNSSRPCTKPAGSSEFGSISLMKNIGTDPGTSNIDCTPYYLMTHSQWYHVQFEVDTTDDCLRLWINDNNTTPTRSYCGENGGGVYGAGSDWNEYKFGGFMSDTPVQTAGKIWDDITIATGFDDDWCVELNGVDCAGEGGGPEPDLTPRRLRFRVAEVPGLFLVAGMVVIRRRQRRA